MRLFSLFKSFLMGLLILQIVLVLKGFGMAFVDLAHGHERRVVVTVYGIFYLIGTAGVLWQMKIGRIIYKAGKSMRMDIGVAFLAGLFFLYSFEGLEPDFIQAWVAAFTWKQVVAIWTLPLVILFSIFYVGFQSWLQSRKAEKRDDVSLFLSDQEGENRADDKFHYQENADRFAECVYNLGSSKSLVFGVDGPWGIGKSTFLNLCKEFWSVGYKGKVSVLAVDLLRYDDKEKLLKKFVEELIREIQKHVYVPEINSLVSRYGRLLRDSKVTFSLFGFRFQPPWRDHPIDEVHASLKEALLGLDKKIIVVVDDLDRLSFSSMRDVLYVIKSAFDLPNLSFVLCYDTDNITALEERHASTEKISEFLEKFVNMKVSLYPDSELLLNYFTEQTADALQQNPVTNPELVSFAIEGLKDIFRSQDFHKYIPFVGDARKIKRLINTILLLEVEQTDFHNADFNKQDLLHLLLIYIHYPNVFRKIYNTEMHGKKGFFSAVTPYEVGYPKEDKSYVQAASNINGRIDYKNSVYYHEYLKELSENQKFLIKKVFHIESRLKDHRDELVFADMASTYACFNGSRGSSDGRNLERYIRLITKLAKPMNTKQRKFYVNKKDEILKEKSIHEVLSEEVFSFAYGEERHERLWYVIVNSRHQDFTTAKAEEVLQYAVEALPSYALLDYKSVGVGFRDNLIYVLVKLLDQLGWQDESGAHWNNVDKNVVQIAARIYGEGEHAGKGILHRLADRERGVLGLHDLLLFRLNCCSDRGADIFNLSRALSLHANPNAPSSGELNTLLIEEMRELSQRVFAIFQSQYIQGKRNLFDEIAHLSLADVSGKALGYLEQKAESGEITDLDQKLTALKSDVVTFMIYQLGSTRISSGIGCGYYDPEGDKDKQGIQKEMNHYLLDFCFNPERSPRGFIHFLDYMLINLGSTRNQEHIPVIFDNELLAAYWAKYGQSIKSSNLGPRDIITTNYRLSVDKDLAGIFEALDGLLNSIEESQGAL